MSEWEKARLGEVLMSVKRPVLVADLEEVPFAGVRWYAEGVYPRTTEPARNVKTKSLTRLELGDVTYNRMWATKAAFGVVEADSAGCLVTGDFPTFVGIEGRVVVDYLRLLFRTRAFQEQASLLAVGTTERRRLKEPDFLRIRVSLPPLPEQRRIVDVMAAVDTQVEALEAEVRAAWPLVVQVAERAWGSDGIQGSSQILSDRFTVVDCEHKTAPAAIDGEDTAGISVGTGDVRFGGIQVATAKRVSPKTLESWTARAVPTSGDLIFTREAPVGEVGRVSEIDHPLCLGQRTVLLRSIGDFPADGLWALLVSDSGRAWLQRHSMGQTVQRVNVGTLKGFPLPSAVEPRVIRALDSTWKVFGALTDELTALRAFRSALLTNLLNQSISIPESYDAFLEAAS